MKKDSTMVSFRIPLMAAIMLVCATACSDGMKIGVAPPQCTVDEKSPNCTSVPTNPSPMAEDDFFQKEDNFFGW